MGQTWFVSALAVGPISETARSRSFTADAAERPLASAVGTTGTTTDDAPAGDGIRFRPRASVPLSDERARALGSRPAERFADARDQRCVTGGRGEINASSFGSRRTPRRSLRAIIHTPRSPPPPAEITQPRPDNAGAPRRRLDSSGPEGI